MGDTVVSDRALKLATYISNCCQILKPLPGTEFPCEPQIMDYGDIRKLAVLIDKTMGSGPKDQPVIDISELAKELAKDADRAMLNATLGQLWNSKSRVGTIRCYLETTLWNRLKGWPQVRR